MENVELQTAVSQTSSETVALQIPSVPTETPILEYLEPLSIKKIVSGDVEEPSTLEQMDMEVSTQEFIAMAAEDLNSAPRYALKSPQRSRGRPKQTPKARKAKNNASLALARDAVTMHQEQLSFVTVQQILSDEVTYRLAAELLRKFSIHPIPKGTKTPKAFEASKSYRAPLGLSDIVQVLPKTMLTKCHTQILKLQNKTAGLAENQAAVDIPGIGIYTPLLLNLMSRWHKAVAALDQVDAAEEWHKTFDGESVIGLSDYFQMERCTDLVNQLRNLDLSSYEVRSFCIGLFYDANVN